MFVKPSVADLREAATRLGMHPSDAYLEAATRIVGPLADAYAALDAAADEVPVVTEDRARSRGPAPDENRHGAWYVKTAIKTRGTAASSPAGASRSRTMCASPACR